MTGTVSNLIIAKGFGFIRGENGQEYFFHRDDLKNNWENFCSKWNDPGVAQINVSFEARSTPKGPRADNVRIE